MAIERVVSGMRPTGSLHLGHYNGVLKNWVDLQHELECLFFVADWHALTTHYDAPEIIEKIHKRVQNRTKQIANSKSSVKTQDDSGWEEIDAN